MKYLGKTITKQGSWKKHTNNITSQSHRTLAFLQRNLYRCPAATKVLGYKSLVRPRVEYAASVWDPYTQTDINKIEAVQRKAARFVMADFRRESSVTEMIQQLQWESLQARRKSTKLVMMYKAVNNLVDLYPEQLRLVPSPRHQHKFIQPHTRIMCYQHAYIPSTIRLWNGLPSSAIISPTLPIFRTALQPVISAKF